MLKAALCGGYVNFGVFGLYGDNALEKALKTFVELLYSIPHSNLLVSCRLRTSLILASFLATEDPFPSCNVISQSRKLGKEIER